MAPEIYRGAGAQVTTIAAEPDGLNINDGVGSTHLDGLIDAVRSTGAHLGIAHDGDADRCLAVDATGAVVDGDQLLAICALALRDGKRLHADTVVATVMSNLGFHHAMRAAGIEVLTTGVGDRYVLEALRAKDLNLGGEQSGHIVFTDSSTTGDGLLTALQVMARMATTGASLADLAGIVHRLPQTLINVPVGDRSAVAASGGGGRGRRARRTRARRRGPGAAAPVRHRAAGPGHGRGRHPAARRRGRPPAGRRRRRGRLSPTPVTGTPGGSAERPALFFSGPEEFRAWLAEHHEHATELWMGLRKKHVPDRGLTWELAVPEALCFGWIDSVVQRIDADAVRQRWTPRTPSSTWSNVNVALVEQLIRDGRMQPAGLAAYERRRADRTGVYSHESDVRDLPERLRPPAGRQPGRVGVLGRGDPDLPARRGQLGARREAGGTRDRRADQLVDDSAHGRLIAPQRYGAVPAWLARAAAAAADAGPGR